MNDPPSRKPGVMVNDVDSLIENLKNDKSNMKTLIIVEHNNDSVKPSTYSTITAASKISDKIDALIIGYNNDSAIDELKKSDHLNKIFNINKRIENPIAENFKSYFRFLKNNDYSHILTPSSTFGKTYLQK